MATPALIQYSWSERPKLFLMSFLPPGSSTHITKFVECPVVESVPRLESCLYTGHRYIPPFGNSLFALGLRYMIGPGRRVVLESNLRARVCVCVSVYVWSMHVKYIPWVPLILSYIQLVSRRILSPPSPWNPSTNSFWIPGARPNSCFPSLCVSLIKCALKFFSKKIKNPISFSVENEKRYRGKG